MRKIVILAACLLLASCDKDPVRRDQTDNTQFQVDDLFTHNGCTVSRFEDGGRNHYFTTCQGAVTTTSTESCGKSCTRIRTDEIPTERKD